MEALRDRQMTELKKEKGKHLRSRMKGGIPRMGREETILKTRFVTLRHLSSYCILYVLQLLNIW